MEKSELLEIMSTPENPLFLIRLKKDVVEDRGIEKGLGEERLLQDVVEELLSHGYLITRCKALPGISPHQPRIRVTVSVGHTRKEVEKMGTALRQVASKVLGRVKK